MSSLPGIGSSIPPLSQNPAEMPQGSRTIPLFQPPRLLSQATLEKKDVASAASFPSLSALKERISLLFSSRWPFLKSLAASAPLPTDPDLIIKRLKNGLTYYVRPNAYPHPQKAALRLIVRTGHLNETKGERGYAHMVEHLTQVETAHFAPRAIDRYFDSLGVSWGGDNNAYTSALETVYILEIPLDNPETLDKTLYILSEVAQQATLSDEMIETERAVVIDELKQRRGSSFRYCKNIWQYLLKGTPYPQLLERDEEIRSIEQCTPQGIRDFYKRWYQPQNMALVAVGDFDPKQAESLIKKHFGKLCPSPTPAKIPSYRPASHEETRFSCFSDPEWTHSIAQIYYKLPCSKKTGHVDAKGIKRSLIHDLATRMLNARFDEIEERESSPFLEAGASKQELIRDCTYFHCSAKSQGGALPAALKQLLLEIKRILQHGFTEQELEKVKQRLTTHLEHALLEKDKTSGLLESCKNHFLEQIPLLSRGKFLETMIRLCPTITLKEVNQWIASVFSEKDRLIVASFPEKAGLPPLEEADLRSLVEETQAEAVDPYVYTSQEGSLLPKPPSPGAIADIKRHEKSQVTEFLLENGCRIFFKPTSFEKDYFAIHAQAIHGIRDLPLYEQTAAKFADDFYARCGLGDFDLTGLRKILNEKTVAIYTRLGPYLTKIQTVSGKKDLETAFQAVHLLFTNPGYSKAAFEKALKEKGEYLRNRPLNPKNLLTDAIIAVNTEDHPEMRPLQLEDLKQVDFATTKRLHQQAFSHPADFSMVIVGNVEEDVVKEYIERYLASLPQEEQAEIKRTYTPIPFPPGVTRKEVYAGKESACTSLLTFPAPILDSKSARRFAIWSCALVQARLQDVLRKQMGKTYTPTCLFLPSPIPALNPIDPSETLISISCDPNHLKKVEEALFREIASLQKEGPGEEEMKSAKTQFLLQRRQFLNTNSGWLNTLAADALWKQEPDDFDRYQEDLSAFDKETAREYLRQIFPPHNYTIVTLYPEKKE